jgi:two-component SAPR family response regulator
MSNKQMTAVEWLVKEISRDRVGRAIITTFLKEFEQAKEKEKQQIIESYSIGFNDGCSYMFDGKTEYKDLEQYYTETYGGENNE